MNGGQRLSNDDGFDSTVFARPRPTDTRSSGLPWIFEPLFSSASRTTILPTTTTRSTDASVSGPSTTKALMPTTTTSDVFEPPQSSHESGRSPETSTSLQRTTREPSSSSTPDVVVSSTSLKPSTLETITSPSSSTLNVLQPSIASLSTLEPFEPEKTSTLSLTTSTSLIIPPPASHTGYSSSQPEPVGGEKSSKTSGALIGGVVGGISGAILVALLLFFCWKWRTRGKYRFKNRSSFDPYGNGIDANRGGLLVSSVAKPSDQSSGKETLYSDDHSPTRYQNTEGKQQPSVSREPAIPTLTEPKPRTHSNDPLTIRTTREHLKEPFPSFSPDVPMNSVIQQQPVRSYQGPARPYPILYERRRPPVPPSMRRNRSPMERTYGDYPPRRNPSLNEPIPGIFAFEQSGLGFAGPYPNNSNIMRSNSIGTHRPPRGYMGMGQIEYQRRMRRSNSMNSLNHRGFTPHNMHHTIPGGPPGMSRGPGAHHRSSRSAPIQYSGSIAPPQDPRHYAYHDQPQSHQIRRNMTARNPTPAYSGVETLGAPARKPLSDMMRRATLRNKTGDNDDDDDQPRLKPKHAAKNF